MRCCQSVIASDNFSNFVKIFSRFQNFIEKLLINDGFLQPLVEAAPLLRHYIQFFLQSKIRIRIKLIPSLVKSSSDCESMPKLSKSKLQMAALKLSFLAT